MADDDASMNLVGQEVETAAAEAASIIHSVDAGVGVTESMSIAMKRNQDLK